MLAAEKYVAAHELIERMYDARRRSDEIFALVRSSSLYERPIPERHRIIFYLGHLEAFDWNLLNENVFGSKNLNPEFDRLFAFGIDPVGGGLPADRPSDWPALDAVRDYVGQVRLALDKNLETAILEPHLQTRDGYPLSVLLNVAIEHRLMHAETLAYMFHQLPLDMKILQPQSLNLVKSPVAHDMVSIPAGAVTLGLPLDDLKSGADFGWDNEYESHIVDVPGFEIDRYEVTNRQYLEFVAARGYETHAFWTEDDWNWKTCHEVSHPSFWKKESTGELGSSFLWRTMFGDVPLPLEWPVYVSHAEASAYARWAGKSLPTEAEWQHAAYGTLYGRTRTYPWGNMAPSSKFGNFNFHRWDPTPVNATPDGQSAFGVHDMLGNGWEWTATAFGPFPGFEPFPFYRGYSADFFEGKHFVMKGGSSRTADCMLRPTFRNWFQPHYQYSYAAFRCVRR